MNDYKRVIRSDKSSIQCC